MVALIGGAAASLSAETPETELNRLVRHYSTQQIVGLNVNETCTFKLKSGAQRAIRLASVREHRDSVINLIRQADVRVEIDGRPLDLVCAPYVLPTEIAGLRLQVDTTSGWAKMAKQIQISIWDATEPVVDTKLFGFPLRNFRLFSQGTQAYNEPVHLGEGDGDPTGQRFHHDYGFDMAGFEGREQVVSATAGRVVRFWPSRENVCSVLVQDSNGFVWEYAHLNSVAAEIVLNTPVAMGQNIGVLGKTGPSGNFSHLHLGTYGSLADVDADKANRRLNLYPWLVAAYQAQHPKGLFAVARPHQSVLTGETAVFDGANSLAFGGGRIVQYRWSFPDGRTVKQARVQRAFDQPGTCVATLWVKDDQGAEDVDFCQVKVFSKANPEKAMPHIFMTHTPTQEVRPEQAVTFRFWFQGKGGSLIKVDFGDGTQLADYRSYTEVQHSFKTPGIHIVTAQCQAAGLPITQKQKVVVAAAPRINE